jgi:hypothetical protein
MKYAFLMIFVSIAFAGLAQEKEEEVSNYIPTDNISKQKAKKKKHAPDRRSISIIIKNKPKKILYGNPCMVEETHRMGFEYALQTPGLPGSLDGFKLLWHNYKVYGKLIVTRSPFWKMILNGRVKDCRERTGDFVG